MIPKYWPKGFIYAAESVAPEMNLSFLRMFLGPVEDLERISWVIENKTVHPHMQILPITKRRFKDHLLAGKRSRRGHVQRGVFATETIPKRTELGEYVGDLYLVDEEKESVKLSEYAFKMKIGPYFFLVEPKNIANELAMINDYRGIESEQNLRAEWIIHRGLRYLGYVTTKDIPAGEELLGNYGDGYWRHTTIGKQLELFPCSNKAH